MPPISLFFCFYFNYIIKKKQNQIEKTKKMENFFDTMAKNL